jgi:SAM-dependent methyltransferase
VLRALGRTGLTTGRALDIPGGEGRHSRLLASLGMAVVAADLDSRALMRCASAAGRWESKIAPVRLDATKSLPFRPDTFDLALIVHFELQDVLSRVHPVLKRGGFLIVETFGAQGENWRALPVVGEVSSRLLERFDLLDYVEKPVRRHSPHATVRAVCRKAR